MNLGYNTDIGIGNTQSYNGNITGMSWSNYLGTGTVKEKAYVYGYDPMSRISTAVFKEKKTGWEIPTDNAFIESGISYDLNGNILGLTRNDRRPLGNMDALVYSYAAASNKLLKVTDSGDKFKGFIDGTNSTDDYTYDKNGNLIKDENKAITTPIVYNYLNLPQTITRGSNTITYAYDAAGQKLTQTLATGSIIKKTDYVGELIYENDC